VVALCAAVRFALPLSEARRIALSRALLPAWWHLPARAVASCAAPWVAERDIGPRLRGVLRYAVEDLPVGLLRHAGRWLREGSLVDRTGLLDYRLALADARVPLLVITAGGDPVCPEIAGAAALETWGHEDRALVALPDAWGHLDVLLSPAADEQVFGPLTRWLSERRQRAWGASAA
jgi:pimeloyl-ACP methyl ester carboxylesterase